MTRSHEEQVRRQFGPQATAYGQSQVHAAGRDLDKLEQIARMNPPQKALDLGCGAGHVGYRLSRFARSVIATDVVPEMLAVSAAMARDGDRDNIEFRLASAEQLPFSSGEFDFLGCRFSAHHWRVFERGLREARRVLSDGGSAVFIDSISPGVPNLDTYLQAIELLRDPSHVRNYSVAEWAAALSRANFRIRSLETDRLEIDFASWIARMRASKATEHAIRRLRQTAPDDVLSYFEVKRDGSFVLDTIFIQAVAS